MWRALSARRRPLLAAASLATASATAYYAYKQRSPLATTTAANATSFKAGNEETWMPRILAEADPSTGRPPIVEPPPPLPTRADLLNALEGLTRDGSPLPSIAASARDPAEFDLLVIGGGATGAGVALDAATRGLNVALVERDDYSAGTSSRSTKLVHGGVRYLEKAFLELDYEQYKLVCEALHERATFLEIAPYLAHQLPIMLPLYKWWQLPYYWAGCKVYDLLAGKEALESSYILSKTKALEAFPMLRADDLVGALVYYDGQHNDSRMNVAIALTAIHHGATVLNHVEVMELVKKTEDGHAEPQICGAVCRDTLTGATFTVKAKGVVNATGPFTDGVRKLDTPTAEDIVAPSAGVHIILPNYYAPADMGLLDPKTSDGRVIFFLPWQGGTIAGTTDSPTDVTSNPRATEEEIAWILGEVRRYLSPEVKVRRGDVLAAWSGIRPLVRDPAASSTAGLVRNHMIHVTPSGLLTIAGGKWTTYRAMAEEVVDLAIQRFQLEPTHAKSQTEHVKLVGSHGYSKNLFIRLVQHFGLETEVAKHLVASYGDRAWAVAALTRATGKSWPLFGKRIVGNYPYLEAEVRYAVRREYACTAVDVLARRTRLAFLNALAAAQAVPKVIAIMSDELGWDEARCRKEYDDSMEFLTYMGLPSAQSIQYPDGSSSNNGDVAATAAAAAAAAATTTAAGAGVAAGSNEDLRAATRAALEAYMAKGFGQSYFTREEVESYRAAFASFDKDADGSIPQHELENLLVRLGWIRASASVKGEMVRAPSSASSSSSWWSFGSSSPSAPTNATAMASESADVDASVLGQVYATTGVDRKRALEFADVLEVLATLRELRASNKLHDDLQSLRARWPGLADRVSTERSGGGV
ncbi:FAD dependent oxidoreductase-domain-containing protein [Blastocladiella britannica]|nr:FAD dependent oxidoreductase-domain-containing protein [Blastocladiella britannica]